MSRVAPRATIGQECDLQVALESDPAPHRADDGDLVLLDDAEMGHADAQEKRLISTRTA
jgi:hypothetical protein